MASAALRASDSTLENGSLAGVEPNCSPSLVESGEYMLDGPQEEPVYSVFSPGLRRYIVVCASWAGLFSLLSANIYFPALNAMGRDLKVSAWEMNLSITTYMVMQGLAPMFVGDFADTAGKRPAYMACFAIYIAANIGLALQNNFAALLVLRCLQSAGSGATIALASGVVADIAPSAQRGSYIGYTMAGSSTGPSIGPVIGGLLAHYLSWRAIFWFLVIMASVFIIQYSLFCPETSRNIVGNGSIPPPRWNKSLVSYADRHESSQHADRPAMRPQWRIPNPVNAILIVFRKDTMLTLLSNAIIICGYYVIAASIPKIFDEKYGYSEFQIGLCFLPFGVGSAVASIITGYIVDWNYKRIAKEIGYPIQRNKERDLKNFPIEKARLQLTLPLLFVACCSTLVFGWTLQFNVSVAFPLAALFFAGASLLGAFNTLGTLIVDLHPNNAATATAANNLVRCLLGAGATAGILPMVDKLGRGWSFTVVAFGMLTTAPMMLATVYYNPGWRKDQEK
ncbi:conserved hypothetical protein [Uncinocarpus reesii 1704]|uniref:Citrate exporter 1 n=1 Tax=Uncinocarpus reesii (strain UAMH 1704) TaxID=336963 RepID=C4JIZ6_UNCRE|nr:uncharacterized protein UREG_01603 [Uncinocarpus reesii 1704]EEP76754.1 conserved hypothetical protein [Uncinocarpus reesii 1704]